MTTKMLYSIVEELYNNQADEKGPLLNDIIDNTGPLVKYNTNLFGRSFIWNLLKTNKMSV